MLSKILVTSVKPVIINVQLVVIIVLVILVAMPKEINPKVANVQKDTLIQM